MTTSNGYEVRGGCDYCGPCSRHGCNGHEEITGGRVSNPPRVAMAHPVVEVDEVAPARRERLAIMVRANGGGEAWRVAQVELARWCMARDGHEPAAYQVIRAMDNAGASGAHRPGLWYVLVDAYWPAAS